MDGLGQDSLSDHGIASFEKMKIEPDIEPDILSRIEEDFSGELAKEALEKIVVSGRKGRVARCVLHCAAGDLEADTTPSSEIEQ